MALPDLSGASPARTSGIELIGRVLAGRYRLVAPVGVGASAQVYVADDVQLRRRVAVKVLHPGLAGDPTFLKRFQAEAQAAAALNHPNVVAVYDWGRDDPSGGGEAVPFLVTEYLEGGSLRAMLDGPDRDRGSRPLSPSQALVVGLEVCRGLHYAHTRGFVHRDAKPANLLFGDDRRLRIADFGLARALAEASWTEPEGVVLGTARYVSPEQAAGLPVDSRSDLYSLALVLVEAVTGEVPHTADTALGTLRARLGRAVTADAATFGALAPLIEAAGRADPAERCTAAQLGAGLMAAAESMPAPDALPLVRIAVREPALHDRHATSMYRGAGGSVERPPVVVGDRPEPVADGAGAAAPSSAVLDGRDPTFPPETKRGRRARRRAAAAAAVPAPSPPAASGPPTGGGDPGLAATRRARRRSRPRRRSAGLTALVVVALGVLAALGVAVFGDRIERGPDAHPVGRYVGADVTDVRRDLDAAGIEWQVTVRDERRAGSRVDEVLAQRPPAGTELEDGATLELVRSLGEPLVVVPSAVVGKPLADPEVQAAFTRAGLVISTREQFDEAQPVGVVLHVEGGGRQVEQGTSVAVVVSKGPEPRTIEDYVELDKTAEQITAELAAAGITAVVIEEASDTVEEGKVISTDPPAGGQVAKGGTVQVVVSSGPPILTVPDLSGSTPAQAAAELEAAGWKVSGTLGSPTGTVIATDPVAGVQRRKGSAITIITGRN